MLPLAYWTHNLSPFVPFLPHSDRFGVRWYGLAYVLGFFGAAWLLQRYARTGRSQLPEARVWDLMLYMILGVAIGGRLGEFLLYHPRTLLDHPLEFFKVWEGGMASHGGFAGVAIALILFARLQRISFLHLADLVASTAALGLMLGRIANFINGELWGKPATVSWAVIFPESPLPLEPRHPSQLYQAGLEGALLLAYIQWRFWKSDVVRRHPGQLAGEFWVGYALLRAIGEVFRVPDGEILGFLSLGTFYSLFILTTGVILILVSRRSAPLAVSKG